MKIKWLSTALIILNLIFCTSTSEKIQQAREKNPRYHYNMGSFYLNNGNVNEAISHFQKSLSLSPNYFLAFNGLGLAYSMKGELEESAKYFQKCLTINPTFSEARNNLGMIYQEMGLLDKAEQEYRQAASDKNYSSRELPYYNLARLCLLQEKSKEALDYVQMALQINKDMAMAYNLKGIINEKLENFDEAIASYLQALRIVPRDVYFNFNLAVAYFKNNELKKAQEIFEEISPRVTDPEMKDKINQYLKIIQK
ncbi:MAG: tetratricopeptide repeat protein [Candidatus Aminicenantes bacterium]